MLTTGLSISYTFALVFGFGKAKNSQRKPNSLNIDLYKTLYTCLHQGEANIWRNNFHVLTVALTKAFHCISQTLERFRTVE